MSGYDLSDGILLEILDFLFFYEERYSFREETFLVPGIRPATYFEKYVPGIFRRLYCEAIASP